MNVSDVRTALFNYQELEFNIKVDNEQIEAINAKRFKAGSWVAKIPENPKSRSEVMLNNMEKHDLVQLSLALHTYQLWIVNDFLQTIKLKEKKWPEARQMIIDRFIKRYSQTKMESIYGYEIRQINRNINKYLEWYVEYRNNSVTKGNNG